MTPEPRAAALDPKAPESVRPRGGVDEAWSRALAGLPAAVGGTVSVGLGWDPAWERGHWQAARRADRAHLSVRLYADETLIGPLWVPRTDAGCSGCAENRSRVVRAHPLVEAPETPAERALPRSPLLPELLAAAVRQLTRKALAPGELYAVGGRSTRRHRVPRSFGCPVCGRSAETPGAPARAPGPLVLRDRPADPHDPARGVHGRLLLAPGALRGRTVDPRFGPVREVVRESRAPYAMSMAALPDAPAMGYARAADFRAAEPVAILEAYERLGGFPHDTAVVEDVAHQDVAGHAVDPASLGQYTPEQLAHPSTRVTASGPDTPMDWVWGHDLDTGEALLVPADIGFYQYDHRFKRSHHAARRAAPHDRKHYFHDSSSGCALGGSLEEAALHSLFELAERDAFLIAWHRAAPLPEIDPASVTDPASRRLLDLIDAQGFDAHLLVATQDIDLPVVWALAVNRERPFPATFSAAGSGCDPASVVRSALWELGQIVTDPVTWARADIEPLLDDPWLVEELDDHLRLYTLPETLDRVTSVLGGRRVRLDEAFPGWPDRLRAEAAGSVRGALDALRARFARAGLRRIVLVDQSTREHRDLGVAVAKAVVPGITPMCFGHAQQRLSGLPRLAAALRGTPTAGRPVPYDPHPFP
ncbi:TOMM precursor leader peptide-binding protein [Streptomyces sp. NPDC048191]|uniref:TOMM precursor leader peptide-binding protein n=1 Tax=Streptomyces sp. NPDC048191 TaxID=3155484 RepID=UPI00340E2C1A